MCSICFSFWIFWINWIPLISSVTDSPLCKTLSKIVVTSSLLYNFTIFDTNRLPKSDFNFSIRILAFKDLMSFWIITVAEMSFSALIENIPSSEVKTYTFLLIKLLPEKFIFLISVKVVSKSKLLSAKFDLLKGLTTFTSLYLFRKCFFSIGFNTFEMHSKESMSKSSTDNPSKNYS